MASRKTKKRKQSDLDRYLQGHKPLCRMHIYSDDNRHCTCGLEGALREVAEMRELIRFYQSTPLLAVQLPIPLEIVYDQQQTTNG